MDAKYFTALGGVAQRFDQADANQHRNIVLGQAQQNGRLLNVEHGGQSPQVEQFPGLGGDEFRFAVRLGGQRFIDQHARSQCQ